MNLSNMRDEQHQYLDLEVSAFSPSKTYQRLKIDISGRPVRIDVIFNWSGFYVGKT